MRQEPPDHEEIQGLLRSGLARLKDAGTLEVDDRLVDDLIKAVKIVADKL